MRRDLSNLVARNAAAAGTLEKVREGYLELAKATGIMMQAEALAVDIAVGDSIEESHLRANEEALREPCPRCHAPFESLGRGSPEMPGKANALPHFLEAIYGQEYRAPLEPQGTSMAEVNREIQWNHPDKLVKEDPESSENLGYIPHQLPPHRGDFFGRVTELGFVASHLRSRKNLMVTGIGGMGKTALAYRALVGLFGEKRNRLACEVFPDGIVFVHLPTFAPAGKDAVWTYIADSFGAGLPHGLPARDRASEVCLDRDCLIILDGGEVAGQTLQELMAVFGPKISILATSRASESVPGWDCIELKELVEPQAKRALFDSCVGEQIVPDWAKEALLIRLGGHPLALRVAGQLLETAGENANSIVKALLGDDVYGPHADGTVEPRREETMNDFFRRGARNLHAEAEGVLARVLFETSPVPLPCEQAGSASDLEVSRVGRVNDATETVEEARVLRNKVSIFTGLVTPLVFAGLPFATSVVTGLAGIFLSRRSDAGTKSLPDDDDAAAGGQSILPEIPSGFYHKAVALAQEGKMEDALDELYEGVHDLAARRDYPAIDRVMAASSISKELLSVNVGLLSSSHPFRKEVSEWKSLYQKLTIYLVDSGRDPKKILPVP